MGAKSPIPRKLRPRCGARCRTKGGAPCLAPATWDAELDEPRNGRCKLHGGLSTGATTPEGRARLREAGRRGGLASGGVIGRQAIARYRAERALGMQQVC
jgi:hypothetical protein